MKKRYTLLLLLGVTLTSIVAQTAQEKWAKLSNCRIDYLDANDNRVASAYPYNGMDIVSTYPEYGDKYEDGPIGYNVLSGQGYRCSKVRMIPPGEYSYPLELTAEKDMSVTIKTNSSKVSRVAKADTSTEQEVLSGEDMTFIVDIPEGTYPMVEFIYEYTDRHYNYAPAWIQLPTGLFTGTFFTNKDYQESIRNTYENDGGVFEPDPEVANRWILETAMPNEPLTLKFSYATPDAELLENIMGNVAQTLYMGMNYGSNNYFPTFFCGDPWTSIAFGETLSADDISNRSQYLFNLLTTLKVLEDPTNIYSANAWYYYLSLVEMSNLYLEKIPYYFGYSGNSNGVSRADILKAQAICRTIRAHAYFRLLQVYGPRWSFSNNGTTPVAPLYTEWNMDTDKELSTFNEICYFIREDLAFAMENLPEKETDNKIVPHKSVAHGLAARLAVLCEDWITAEEESRKVLELYPLTSNEELLNGFCEAAPSWVWTATCPVELIGYYSFQSNAAVNGAYNYFWNEGTVIGSIDKQLYDQMKEEDVRRQMFIMPGNGNTMLNRLKNKFFASDGVDPFNMQLTGSVLRRTAQKVVSLYQPAFISDSDFSDSDYNIDQLNLYFGSQMKFWGHETGRYSGKDEVCFMRADEFLLIRAEALTQMGRNAEALQCLNTLNTLRSPGNEITASDSNLLMEILLARRLELWGEGFSFFDFKRTEQEMTRKIWVEGDVNSGNWLPEIESYGGTFNSATAANGWRAMIPASMVRANKNIDINSLGYSDLSAYEQAENAPQKVAPKAAGKKASVLKLVEKRD